MFTPSKCAHAVQNLHGDLSIALTGGDPFPSAEVIDEGRRQFEELFELIALLRGEEGLQAQSLKRQLRDDLFPDLDRKANGFAQSVERFWTGASEDQSCRGVISGEARTMLDRIFNHANDPNARLLREHPWVLRGGGDMNGRFGGDMNGRFGGGPHAATPTPAVAQPCSPGSHTFTRRQCLVCLDCGCCTGWGRGCVEHREGRSRGGACKFTRPKACAYWARPNVTAAAAAPAAAARVWYQVAVDQVIQAALPVGDAGPAAERLVPSLLGQLRAGRCRSTARNYRSWCPSRGARCSKHAHAWTRQAAMWTLRRTCCSHPQADEQTVLVVRFYKDSRGAIAHLDYVHHRIGWGRTCRELNVI
jgi:hypothetical protein